jgi:hypothetical protein
MRRKGYLKRAKAFVGRCSECGKVLAGIRPNRFDGGRKRRCIGCYRKTVTGRTRHGEGYIQITTIPGRKGKKILEHRLVMERMIGRSLRPGEVVHHINEIRDDNRPENLELFASVGRHIADRHPKHRRPT